jgi:hypothetical protein
VTSADEFPLLAHHRDLECSFLRAIDYLHSGDPLEARTAWLLFERELDEHFAAEEKYLIREYARSFPEEAAMLCQEHRDLRRRLAELAIKMDLHILRHEHAMGFVTVLREHAATEAELLYPWAEENLTDELANRLGARLGRLSHEVAEALGGTLNGDN